MNRQPTPACLKPVILRAIIEYNEANPDAMFPATAYQVIDAAITKECDEHEAFLKEAGKL